MSDDYDEVSSFLKKVADAWGTCSERLEQVGAEISELSARVQDGGMRPTIQLRAIEDELAQARVMALEDPVAFTSQSIDALEEQVARARATVDVAIRGREARIRELADADSAVQACRSAVLACQDELERLAQKIVVRDVTWAAIDAAAGDVDVLSTEQERAAQLGNDAAAAGIRCVRKSAASPPQSSRGPSGATSSGVYWAHTARRPWRWGWRRISRSTSCTRPPRTSCIRRRVTWTYPRDWSVTLAKSFTSDQAPHHDGVSAS